jgi:hypothetical protein
MLPGSSIASALTALGEIEQEARALLEQVARGVHINPRRNPPLLIVGNPPLQLSRRGRDRIYSGDGPLRFEEQMSSEVHSLAYRHSEDDKLYKHEFEKPTEMWAVKRGDKKDILLTSFGAAPLWQDFK